MNTCINSLKILFPQLVLITVTLSFSVNAQSQKESAKSLWSHLELTQNKDLQIHNIISDFSCRGDTIRNQFYFWIGEWDVFVDEEKVAESRIQRTLDGCMILESYQNLKSGYAGKSMNFYDAKQKQWIQIWTDSEGSVSRYQGKKKGKKMYFSGTNNLRDGSQTLVRMEFTPINESSVQQIYEQSTDGGRTWETLFDGIYRSLNK